MEALSLKGKYVMVCNSMCLPFLNVIIKKVIHIIGNALQVVINDSLMDNHQQELANAVEKLNYCLACVVGDVLQALMHADFSNIEKYPEPNFFAFPAMLDTIFCWE